MWQWRTITINITSSPIKITNGTQITSWSHFDKIIFTILFIFMRLVTLSLLIKNTFSVYSIILKISYSLEKISRKDMRHAVLFFSKLHFLLQKSFYPSLDKVFLPWSIFWVLIYFINLFFEMKSKFSSSLHSSSSSIVKFFNAISYLFF